MSDYCTRKGGGEKKKERETLVALHEIQGPTGAAVPGENPFAGCTLASTVLFIKRRAI